MLPTKYSRHLQNIHEKSKKSRNSLDMKLISMIDEEQLNKTPSSEDWWSRRKSQILGAQDDQSFCPCLSTMFRNQVKEIQRLTTPRGSLDLTLVSRLDDQQLSSTSSINRRPSLPLERFVSILDEEQNKSRKNETVLKAIEKIKRLKCECDGKKEENNLRLPVVNIVPSTPQFHTIISEGDREDRGNLSVIEANNSLLNPGICKEKRKHHNRHKHKSV